MSHPDDGAEATDPSQIDVLINAAAPERSNDWLLLREEHQITFHPIADRKGVTLRARGHRVEFDNKTMTWLWMLGFAGWKAFRLHGPHLLWRSVTGAKIDGHIREADPTYQDAVTDLETVLYVVRDLPKLESVDWDVSWPSEIPRVQIDKNGLDDQQQAAFDLTMIATTYMLLHEVRHIVFRSEAKRPAAVDEELACDAFARQFLLANAKEYAAASGEDTQLVIAKRAAGIALGAYALYGFTPKSARSGTSDYPPVADRIEAIFSNIDLPDDHWFWDFSASLLISIIVQNAPESVVPKANGADLCTKLAENIRQLMP